LVEGRDVVCHGALWYRKRVRPHSSEVRDSEEFLGLPLPGCERAQEHWPRRVRKSRNPPEFSHLHGDLSLC
jgi:hypothetical protein